jgi:predicted dehydrogenase
VYGIWRFQGGGSLMGKGCHPLSAILYLKRIEGLALAGKPIRPAAVSCRCHRLTEIEDFRDKGFIRTGYHDCEDHVLAHVVFEDGTVGDVLSGEVVLGGIYNYVEIFANNHRTRCNLSPAALVDTFNPSGPQYDDVYTVEKISTKEGWTALAPDENYTLGYLHEIQDFLECAAAGTQPESDLDLALDTITTIYAAYLSDERCGQETEIPLL